MTREESRERESQGREFALQRHISERRREASTMALYVAICLLAALSATTDTNDHTQARVLGLVWGTTIGLALAHWIAFRVSSRLVNFGRLDRSDAELAVAQVAGAAFVAAWCTMFVLLTPQSAERDVVRLALAFLVALVGFALARFSGANRVRSAAYSAVLASMTICVALAKNILAEH